MSTLDNLSGGRVIFGAGLGGPIEDEYGSFGEPTDPRLLAELLDELHRCESWLDSLSTELWRVPEMRLLVRRVVAAASPRDLLDLSLLVAGDAWAGPARAATTPNGSPGPRASRRKS